MQLSTHRILLVLVLILLFVGVGAAQAQEQSITLDHVVGGIAERGVIYAGKPIEFHLRFTNETDSCYVISNGFEVYSPDGAEWDSLNATITDAWNAQDEYLHDLLDFRNGQTPTSPPAWGFDTARVAFYTHLGKSLPCRSLNPYFDDIALIIKIGPIDEQYVGHTICLDSSFVSPGYIWKWDSFLEPTVHPEWSGPHCFEIASCCPPGGTVGNADLDPDGVVDIADLGAMIDQLLIQNKYPVCPIAGDLEPAMFGGEFDGIVDLGDITAMIRHLFITFEPLPPCPEDL